MEFLGRLQKNMKSESEAYGYTLSVWGSGALLLQTYNLEASHIFLFVLGGVLGFGLLDYIAFRGLKNRVNIKPPEDILSGSMIHLMSALGTLLISYLMIMAGFGLEVMYTALLVGFNTTFSYNVLLLLEGIFYEDLFKLEEQLFGKRM